MSQGDRSETRPRVLLLRGYAANPWDLRPWEELGDEFDVSYVVPRRNRHDPSMLGLDRVDATTLRDRLPRGRIGEAAGHVLGDRYLGLERLLSGADIVHAAELGYWFSRQAALAKRRHRYRLALTVWETIPFCGTYRHFLRSRACRDEVMAATDLYLPATERARAGLLLEGVPSDRITVSGPGIDVERFAAAAESTTQPGEHIVLSVGRLVWEKGHQDLLRAVAALRRGVVASPVKPRAMIVGAGPESSRLRAYARELGIESHVEFIEHVSYERIVEIYAQASCFVLASLAIPSWEEQFGMVLAEAMAARLWIVASSSGAIPEVLGDSATLFAPGDWLGLAQALAQGPLAAPAGRRHEPDAERLATFSAQAAAGRLRTAYRELLAG